MKKIRLANKEADEIWAILQYYRDMATHDHESDYCGFEKGTKEHKRITELMEKVA